MGCTVRKTTRKVKRKMALSTERALFFEIQFPYNRDLCQFVKKTLSHWLLTEGDWCKYNLQTLVSSNKEKVEFQRLDGRAKGELIVVNDYIITVVVTAYLGVKTLESAVMAVDDVKSLTNFLFINLKLKTCAWRFSSKNNLLLLKKINGVLNEHCLG